MSKLVLIKNLKRFHKLFIFLFIFFLIFLFPTILAENNEKITFIVLGHVYPDYPALNLSLDLIEKENPDFVIFLGDSFEEPGMPFEKIEIFLKKIKVPIYFVPGNHDIYEDGSLEGNYRKNVSKILFSDFVLKGTHFILLNTAIRQNKIYDVSNEQVEFVKAIYEKENTNKIIFMHNCLFYNYDNQFCNSKEFFITNNWNKELVPAIQNETLAVFVGDVGVNEPYFGYLENNLPYFGVGFSPKESQLKIPQHFLKVVLEGDKLTVNPVIIRQDLTDSEYFLRRDKEFFPLFKAAIKKNLHIVLPIFVSVSTFLSILLVFLLVFIKKKKVLI